MFQIPYPWNSTSTMLMTSPLIKNHATSYQSKICMYVLTHFLYRSIMDLSHNFSIQKWKNLKHYMLKYQHSTWHMHYVQIRLQRYALSNITFHTPLIIIIRFCIFILSAVIVKAADIQTYCRSQIFCAKHQFSWLTTFIWANE